MTTNTEFDFPHVPLSDQEKEEVFSVLKAGNPLFRKWGSAIYGQANKGKKFRQTFLSGVVCEGEDLCPLIPADEIARMRAVVAVESRVILGYSRMVWRLANRYRDKFGSRIYFDVGDLFQEGLMGLREAVYGYQDKDGKPTPRFITYAWWAVYRNLMKKVLGGYPLARIPGSGLKVMERFFKLQNEHPYLVFDEVVSRGNFTPREVAALTAIRVGVFRSGDVRDVSNDFNGLEQIPAEGDDALSDMVVNDAVSAAHLSPVERELLDAKLSGPVVNRQRLADGGRWGFLSEIASRHTNARGEPLTRAGARVILKRAESKVRNSLCAAGMAPATAAEGRPERVRRELVIPDRPDVAEDAGLENKLGIPPEVLLSYVKRLVAGEPRRRLVQEMQQNGYHISVTALYNRAQAYKAKRLKSTNAA